MSNSVTFLVKDTIILRTLEQLLNHYIDLCLQYADTRTPKESERMEGWRRQAPELDPPQRRSAEQLRLTAASAGAQTAEKVVKSS